MEKETEFRVFDLANLNVFEKAEKYQSELYKKYDCVTVDTISFNKIMITGHN